MEDRTTLRMRAFFLSFALATACEQSPSFETTPVGEIPEDGNPGSSADARASKRSAGGGVQDFGGDDGIADGEDSDELILPPPDARMVVRSDDVAARPNSTTTDAGDGSEGSGGPAGSEGRPEVPVGGGPAGTEGRPEVPIGGGPAGTEGSPSLPPSGSGSGGSEGTPEIPVYDETGNEPSPNFEQGMISFLWGGTSVSQQIVMRRVVASQALNYQQGVRSTANDTFAIGGLPVATQNSFTQNATATGALDVMVVIDNSGSMAEEQNNLATKLAPLLQSIATADWRIAVNTTDPNGGCQRALIRKGDAGANATFATAVTAGTNGSGNERGILQAVNGLRCNSGSWLRPNSAIAVLIVSDEDNCSNNGSDCTGQPHASPDYLINELGALRQVGVNARIYGLIRHTSQTAAQCSTAANIGRQYSDAISRTNGTWGSICAANYSATLAAMSQHISITLMSQFTLSNVPAGAAPRILVNGVLQTSGYTITGNILSFTTPPPAGAAIAVDFEYYPTEPIRTFTFSNVPDLSTLTVTVDGAPLESSSFTYNAATKQISFATAPAGNALVASYKYGSLNSDLLVTGMVIPDTCVASVNGQIRSDITMAKRDGAWWLHFSAPPTDGAAITVSSQVYTDPVLSYDTNVPADSASVALSDVDDGAAIGFQLTQGDVLVDTGEFMMGREATVSYQTTAATTVVNAPTGVIVDTVKVEGAAEGCHVNYADSKFSFTNCGFTVGNPVRVTFVREI